jgi:hypothetical protein
MTFLTGDMKAIGPLLVGGTNESCNIFKIVMKPLQDREMAAIAGIVKRTPERSRER